MIYGLGAQRKTVNIAGDAITNIPFPGFVTGKVLVFPAFQTCPFTQGARGATSGKPASPTQQNGFLLTVRGKTIHGDLSEKQRRPALSKQS